MITSVVDCMRSSHGYELKVVIDIDCITIVDKDVLGPDICDHWVCLNNCFVVGGSLEGANSVLAGSANITLVTMNT